MTTVRFLIPSLAFVFLVLACSSGRPPPPAPTYTPLPTHTLAPTYTPYPTIIPVPTTTPLPTYTPYPTATPRPTYTPYPTPAFSPVPVSGDWHLTNWEDGSRAAIKISDVTTLGDGVVTYPSFLEIGCYDNEFSWLVGSFWETWEVGEFSGTYSLDGGLPVPIQLVVIEDLETVFFGINSDDDPLFIRIMLSAEDSLTMATGDYSSTWDMAGVREAVEGHLSECVDG